ncbi:RTA1 like protein, partial [Tothia fuscella]
CLQISKYCTVENSIYGYKPSIGWNSFFLAVFLVSSLIHAFQGWKYKTWSFLVAMVIGGLSEAVGQGGRIMLHKNVYDDAGFKLQIVLLTLAPAFLCAGIYLTLKHLVISFGASFSRLPPKWYTWIFISCDIFSIVLQGAGGGLASAADDNDTTLLNAGNNLMIAGLAWQVFTLVLFGALSAEYVYQIRRHVHELNPQTHDMRQSKRFKFFVGAVALAYIAILMRCVYRVAEMAGGWGNEIMQDEAMMLGLDSFMIAIAMVALNLFHPGLCFDFRRYGSN